MIYTEVKTERKKFFKTLRQDAIEIINFKK